MINLDIDKLKNEGFSLVLSGGSAFGLAHIGVIKFLEENNLIPNEIIGTSIGAIIGAIYSIGYSSTEIENILDELNLIKLIDYGFGKPSFIKSQKLKSFYLKYFENKKLNDVNIPLKIVATHLSTGNIEIFDKLNNIKIIDAVMASSALPVIFPPVVIKSQEYVDGYISSNLPVEFAISKNILAVDVVNKHLLKKPFKTNKKKFFFNTKSKIMFKLYNRMMLIMQINQSRFKIVQNENIIHIIPDLSKYKQFDFAKSCEIIKVGYDEINNKFKK